MNWSSVVVSTKTSDTEPSVTLEFENAKYAFNFGEGFSRSLMASRRNWRKTKACFLTSMSIDRANGMTGTLMSFADSSSPQVNIVGPPGLTHWLAAMRSFTFRKTCSVVATEIPLLTHDHKVPLFKDQNVTIYGFPIFAQDTNTEVQETGSKRKRSPSPERPSKRRQFDSLDKALSDRSLKPSSLEEYPQLAQEYRARMLSVMFPGTHKASEVLREQTKRNRELKGLTPLPPVQAPKPDPNGLKKSRRGKKFKGTAEDLAHSQANPVEGMILKDEASSSTPAALVDVSAPPLSPTSGPADEYGRRRKPAGFHLQLPKFADPTLSPSDPLKRPTVAYVAVGPRYRGKFNAERAKELGIPSGPLRSKLSKGEAVTFTTAAGEERTVKSEEVMGESFSPAVVVVLDVPTPGHIPCLVNTFTESPFFSQYHVRHQEFANDHTVRTVYHMCGPGVLEDERYVKFMNGFSPDTHHMFSSPEHNLDRAVFTSPAYNQLRLNTLDSDMFPIPKYSLQPKKDYKDIPNLPANIQPMRTNIVTSMRPPMPPVVDPSLDVPDNFHLQVTSDKPLEMSDDVTKRFEEAKSLVKTFTENHKEALELKKGKDVKIWTLGTGSAIPSNYRNVMSNLIQIPRYGNILLDCGEGTWGQIARAFGSDESLPGNAWEVLRNLKCVFASHLHADHHIGLSRILSMRKRLDPPPSEPLYLVSTRRVHLYLREVSDIEDLGIDEEPNGVVTVLSEALHWKQRLSYPKEGVWAVNGNEPWTDIDRSRKKVGKMCRALGLTSFTTVDVKHRTACFGVVINHKNNWSIVFSGDTIPTQTLVQAGGNPTVLIHEATLSDEQEAMAIDKHHSTFGQAIAVGKDMRAENILLTHFSARFPKIPPGVLTLPSPHSHEMPKDPVVALAFDNVCFRVGDMWKMSFYQRAIEDDYKETRNEVDEEEEERVAASAMEAEVA